MKFYTTINTDSGKVTRQTYNSRFCRFLKDFDKGLMTGMVLIDLQNAFEKKIAAIGLSDYSYQIIKFYQIIPFTSIVQSNFRNL